MNRRNWGSTEDPEMSGGAPFRINNYMPRTRLEVIFRYLRYRVQNYVGCFDGFFRMLKME